MIAYRWALLLAVAAAIALAGCRGATPATDPEPPEPPAPPDPAALLVGTWTFTDPDNLVQTLTFTGGAAPRAIIHYAERDADDTVTAMSVETGTWSVADGIVTRTFNDEGTTVHVPKLYRLTDDGALIMQPWDWGEVSDDPEAMVTYAPVAAPLAGLIGPTWQWRRNEGAFTVSSMLTLNADGTFASVSTIPDGTVRTLAGAYQWDAETLTAALSDMTFTVHPPGGEPETNPWTADRDPFWYAFAPTNDPDVIVVSPPHLDHTQPYGQYGDYYDKVK